MYVTNVSGALPYVLYVIRNFPAIFTNGVCFVFVIIGAAMATTLNRIKSDFEFIIGNNVFVSHLILTKNMMEVLHCYQRVCLVVKQLLRCFEWIFMSQITYAFVTSVHQTFISLNENDDYKSRLKIIWTVEPLLRVWLIVFTADSINNAVR